MFSDPNSLSRDQLSAVNRSAVRHLVAELRSGTYRQGYSRLIQIGPHEEISYCCLGVACLLAKQLGVRLEITIGVSESHPGSITTIQVRDQDGRSTGSVLPPAVAKFFGFPHENPPVLVDDQVIGEHLVSASVANDELRMDFAAIADAFERTYLSDDEPEVSQ